MGNICGAPDNSKEEFDGKGIYIRSIIGEVKSFEYKADMKVEVFRD